SSAWPLSGGYTLFPPQNMMACTWPTHPGGHVIRMRSTVHVGRLCWKNRKPFVLPATVIPKTWIASLMPGDPFPLWLFVAGEYGAISATRCHGDRDTGIHPDAHRTEPMRLHVGLGQLECVNEIAAGRDGDGSRSGAGRFLESAAVIPASGRHDGQCRRTGRNGKRADAADGHFDIKRGHGALRQESENPDHLRGSVRGYVHILCDRAALVVGCDHRDERPAGRFGLADEVVARVPGVSASRAADTQVAGVRAGDLNSEACGLADVAQDGVVGSGVKVVIQGVERDAGRPVSDGATGEIGLSVVQILNARLDRIPRVQA